ncbi:MAG: ParB/RepB/Spo0J family partition protein [Anaerolineaceae bacterium]
MSAELVELFHFALEDVRPNPFQTRESEDPEHIKQLAESIRAHGLMQIPTGRAISDSEVELAFGHSRLAAYKLLFEQGIEGARYFPVNIKELTDPQMFEMAVAENLERKDLTPIEEAKAMQRYMVDFHKTSAEVGTLFHLSDSAVRNKLRLLGLPEEVQQGLKERKITEGSAREVLTWLELPEDFRLEHSYHLRNWNQKNDKSIDPIIDAVMKGSNSENIHEMVTDVVDRGNRLSEAPWKWDEQLLGDGIFGLCKGCPQKFEREGKAICVNDECFKAKRHAWQQRYLQQASLLSGIPVLESEKDHDHYYLSQFSAYNSSSMNALKKSIAGHCENLRLVFDSSAVSSEKENHLKELGFPNAEILCSKRSGFCTCMKMADRGMEIKAGEDGKLDSETLKEANRLRREQDRLDTELVDAMQAKTAKVIYQALKEGSIEIWFEIARRVDYGMGNELRCRDSVTVSDIQFAIATKLAVANRYNNTPKDMVKEFNKCLKKLGLDPLDWEIEAEPQPAGKTLMEVFDEEGEKE